MFFLIWSTCRILDALSSYLNCTYFKSFWIKASHECKVTWTFTFDYNPVSRWCVCCVSQLWWGFPEGERELPNREGSVAAAPLLRVWRYAWLLLSNNNSGREDQRELTDTAVCRRPLLLLTWTVPTVDLLYIVYKDIESVKLEEISNEREVLTY